jgi:hypothetical protein
MLALVLGLFFNFAVPSAAASQTGFFPVPATPARTIRKSPYLLRERNDLCARAHLLSLEFIGVSAVPQAGNFCEYATENLPLPVQGALEEVIRIQGKISEALELGSDSLFGAGHRLVFRSYSVGSIGSGTDAGGVTLTVLPDWTLGDFPSMIYAHEVVHALWRAPGLFSDMTEGLSLHPLLAEALPDLIAAVAFDSPILTLGETAFPDAIRRHRDASPPRSFDEPFGSFSLFANLRALEAQCRQLDFSRELPAVELLCSRVKATLESVEAKRRQILEKTGSVGLALEEGAPFRPELCLTYTRGGLTVFDACDPHQFSPPLVSFFFRVREKTGRHALGVFLRSLATTVRAAPVFECRYLDGTPEFGGKKAILKKPSLLEAFRSLRSSLDVSGQDAFDRAWTESAFGKFTEIDRLYRTRIFGSRTAVALAKANHEFAESRGCGRLDLYEMAPERCRVECREKVL